jgi:hypothetical protein
MSSFAIPTRAYKSDSVDLLKLLEEKDRTRIIVLVDRLTRQIHARAVKKTPISKTIYNFMIKEGYKATPLKKFSDSEAHIHNHL